MVLLVVAGKALGVGDDHRADALAGGLVGIAEDVLPALDGQVTRSTHADIALGCDVACGQGDVALRCGQAGVAAHRQLGAGDGVGLAGTGALLVVVAVRQPCRVVEGPAFAVASVAAGLGVVRNVEHDVLAREQQGVAFGRDLSALAGDRAVAGEQREIATGGKLADARIAGACVLRRIGAMAAGLDHHRGDRGHGAGGSAFGIAADLAHGRAGVDHVLGGRIAGTAVRRARIVGHSNREAIGLARLTGLVIHRVLTCQQRDVLGGQGQVLARTEIRRGDGQLIACADDKIAIGRADRRSDLRHRVGRVLAIAACMAVANAGNATADAAGQAGSLLAEAMRFAAGVLRRLDGDVVARSQAHIAGGEDGRAHHGHIIACSDVDRVTTERRADRERVVPLVVRGRGLAAERALLLLGHVLHGVVLLAGGEQVDVVAGGQGDAAVLGGGRCGGEGDVVAGLHRQVAAGTELGAVDGFVAGRGGLLEVLARFQRVAGVDRGQRAGIDVVAGADP
ncbi:hypothetical protein XMIN_4548 [Xanthomonas citri pv. mangiferaeindicae LMG 941]|nr:hypothetical protein XMIN_4548 [Xanthomonas citri pv. mangiferaeindicae LMG 941]